MAYHQLCEDALVRHNSQHGSKGAIIPPGVLEHLQQKERSESTATPSESSKIGRRHRWADLDSDTDEVDVVVPSPLSACTTPQRKATELRWADLVSDDEDNGRAGQSFARPRFAKVNREQRIAQLAEPIDEFCNLDFESVSFENQGGLVLRMLATLKSLAMVDVYWTESGEKCEEERFKLLGLTEEHMYAIGRHIRRTNEFCDNRKFRKAFDSLCNARPCFAGGSCEDLRAEWGLVEEHDVEKTRKVTSTARHCEDKTKLTEEGWDKVDSAKKVKGKQIKQAMNRRPPESRDNWVERHGEGKNKLRLEPWRANQELMFAAGKKSLATSSSRVNGVPDRRDGFSVSKLQCQFTLGIEEDNMFGVVRRVLGSAGANMKRIAADTGVKLRLRGRGSKFLEGPERKESSDPLMLCVSAPSLAAYHAAVAAVESLLKCVYDDYRGFCARTCLPMPEVSFQFHEGAREGAR